MTRSLSTARAVGLAAAALGAAAGIAEVVAGTTAWTGNKNDPVTLGLVTVLLAGVLGAAAAAVPMATTADRALAIAAALLLTAVLGLTTAGLAWVPAAVTGLVAGALVAREAASQGRLRTVIRRNWLPMLLVVLALIYLALGLTYAGPAGLLGVAGAVVLLAALAIRSRSRSLALAMLVCGALPFAVATFWSLVTPLTCVLLIAIGAWVIMRPTAAAARGRS